MQYKTVLFVHTGVHGVRTGYIRRNGARHRTLCSVFCSFLRKSLCFSDQLFPCDRVSRKLHRIVLQDVLRVAHGELTVTVGIGGLCAVCGEPGRFACNEIRIGPQRVLCIVNADFAVPRSDRRAAVRALLRAIQIPGCIFSHRPALPSLHSPRSRREMYPRSRC